ncbi:hypothetical protein [Austwickia chelonae]|uniref:hypothetical protein n=1 Tax=Austwickia chelonae TaxID=100225 RepID=UPI0013C3649A|nr:hypothetical protein [Austwickia chelonae]
MPPDLVERINASLRQEAELRKKSEGDVTYALFAGRTNRPHRGRSLQVAAAAAVFLTASAAAVAGLGGSGEGLVGMLSSPLQKPSTSAESSPTSDAKSFAGNHDTVGRDNRSTVRGTPSFHMNTEGYSARDLLDQARNLSKERTGEMSGGAPESPHIGPIGTPLGLSSCLKALGLPGDSQAIVDISTYEGKPSAVIVTRIGDHHQVHVVKRSCSEGSPELMVGPYAF